MRIALFALAALAATGCMSRESSDESATEPTADLQISISIRGSEAPTKMWTLQCPDGGGTLPDADEACRRLGEVENPFAPVPEGTACTQVYGGPRIADVSGAYKGEAVNTQFSRGNGCEIERWDKVDFLFPSE